MNTQYWILDAGVWRLNQHELIPFIVSDNQGISHKIENLAIVCQQANKQWFWRVFNDLAWRLEGEPELTLSGLELEGYMPTLVIGQEICEQRIDEIRKRAATQGKRHDHLHLVETQTHYLFRFIGNALVAIILAGMAFYLISTLATVIGG